MNFSFYGKTFSRRTQIFFGSGGIVRLTSKTCAKPNVRQSFEKKEIFIRFERFWRFHQLLSARKGLYAIAWKDSVCSYNDMIVRFGRPVRELCMITNRDMDFIYDLHDHQITQWNPTILKSRLLEEYATAISDKGAALDNCFGLVDGTVQPIFRPGFFQVPNLHT